MFQLIFRGECQPGTDVQTARNNARTLFKASPDQLERMFSGRPVVIRNRLEQDQAEKYRAVLARHGMVAHVEPMATAAPEAPAEPARPAPASAPPPEPEKPVRQPPTGDDGVALRTEPGDRLPVAGDRVETILAGSRLTLDPAGTRLAEEQDVSEPIFDHLDDWTLAPAGTDLGVRRDTPPPIIPDVSHLSLEDVPDSSEQ